MLATMSPASASDGGPAIRSRVWNRDFFLLWQGQLVSAAGDAAWQVALGFWLLETTGSAAITGGVFAAGVLPRALVAPLAGVLADRISRKRILIAADLLAGLVAVAVGAAALCGALQVWMVLVAAGALGLAAAFFHPAAEALVPDLVPRQGLVRANSSLAVVNSAASLLGNGLGGVLFRLLGAGLLFVADGVSYLLSAISEAFIRDPGSTALHDDAPRPGVLADLREGLACAAGAPGLRGLLAVTAVINFFGTAAMFLLLPMCQRSELLGAVWYGTILGAFAAGGLAALALGSLTDLSRGRRFATLIGFGALDGLAFALLPWAAWPAAMAALAVIVGFCTSVENMLLMSAMQAAVEDRLRGKLFGLRGSLVLGLVPLAMLAGGAAAERWDERVLISLASAAVLLAFAALIPLAAARRLLAFDD